VYGADCDCYCRSRRRVIFDCDWSSVVCSSDLDRGQAVGVGGRGVGEDTGGADRGLGREQGVVVVGDREVQDLAALVGGSGGDGGGPRVGGLGPGVLVDGLVGALGEAGGVVDGADGDRDGGHVGVQGPVVGLVGEGVPAVEVGGRGVGEGAVGVHRGRAVARTGDLRVAQAGAVDVGAGHRVVERCVLVGEHVLVRTHRGVVDGG